MVLSVSTETNSLIACRKHEMEEWWIQKNGVWGTGVGTLIGGKTGSRSNNLGQNIIIVLSSDLLKDVSRSANPELMVVYFSGRLDVSFSVVSRVMLVCSGNLPRQITSNEIWIQVVDYTDLPCKKLQCVFQCTQSWVRVSAWQGRHNAALI